MGCFQPGGGAAETSPLIGEDLCDVDKDGVPSGNFCTLLLILWLALTSTGQGSPFPSEVV
jgi:hypothetical protein